MIRQLLPVPGPIEDPEGLEDFYLVAAGDHLRLNFVASLDGAVEVEGRSGPLGGPADRAAFMAMRAVSDVVLVGAGTARAENYGPVRLDPAALERRAARGQLSPAPLAVVTARADLDPTARMFSPDGPVIVLTSEAGARSRPDLLEVADVVTCGPEMVDPGLMLAELRRRGLGRVLCEGGPALAHTLFAVEAVDELCLTLSPLLAGAHRRHLVGEEPLPRGGRFSLTGLLEADSMLLARYRPEPV